jgi:probable phosphoglycerate mutase
MNDKAKPDVVAGPVEVVAGKAGKPIRAGDPAYVCVARHGETDWNIAGILQGWIDVAINDQGRRQAYELVAGFAGSGFTCIYSSPLVRALETAQIIARSLRLPSPVCHDGLRERNFGAIQGIPKAELAELNPVLLQQILKRNPATFFEQGETMDEFADRVLAAVESIAETHSGERVLVITHGWVMDVITRHIANLPRSAMLNMKRKNGECLWLAVTPTTIGPL